MPNNRNAKKTMRQDVKRRARNRIVRTVLKTYVRKAKDAATSTVAGETDTALRTAVKKLDQAASKGYIHRNKAARLKSRLSKAVAKAKPA